jgi:hypothetical protein
LCTGQNAFYRERRRPIITRVIICVFVNWVLRSVRAESTLPVLATGAADDHSYLLRSFHSSSLLQRNEQSPQPRMVLPQWGKEAGCATLRPTSQVELKRRSLTINYVGVLKASANVTRVTSVPDIERMPEKQLICVCVCERLTASRLDLYTIGIQRRKKTHYTHSHTHELCHWHGTTL